MGNETWAVYNPRLLDDIPAWVIENIQAVSAYMKTRGHEEWTIAGVRSQSAHDREVEALRLRAEAAEAREENALGLLAHICDNLADMPISELWASRVVRLIGPLIEPKADDRLTPLIGTRVLIIPADAVEVKS